MAVDEPVLGFWFSGLGATLNVAKPTKGSTVAVFGLGAVGLAVSSCPLSCFSYLFCFGQNFLLEILFFIVIRLQKGLGLLALRGLLGLI